MQSKYSINDNFRLKKANPSITVLVGFGVIIIAGTLLLLLPAAVKDKAGITFIDALFTSTSAVCVTGLIVRDTEHFFTPFGHFVILCLIQLGGLGYMTLSTFLSVSVAKKLSSNVRYQTIDEFQRFSAKNIRRFLQSVILFTFTAEAIGALLLLPNMLRHVNDPLKAVWFSVFHSVSAFCNAGFSLFSENFVLLKNDPFAVLVVSMLIIIGGFGFIAIGDIRRNIFKKRRQFQVHTIVAFLMTAFLVLIPFVIFFFLERNNSLSELTIFNKIVNAGLQAVTPRTAGFNTLDLSMMKNATLFMFILMMFVGASPGGTGGGIKTTTIFVVFSAMINKLKGRKKLNLFRRNINEETIFRSYFILSISLFLIAASFLFLLMSESYDPFKLLFETVSAFGTVGLSSGLKGTSVSLSGGFTWVGKMIIIIVMIIGRIGIMTSISLFITKDRSETIKYPETKITVG
ncbi:MAG: TrkH family potassium uptake protein [bacterium]|nr:TrkH family potassium uptake protein [bacterium]